MKVSTLQKETLSKTRINQRVQQMPPSGIRAFFELVIGKKDVISLGVGEPDFITPWHIREAGIHSLETGQTSYTSNSGLLELREEIAAYLLKTAGSSYDCRSEILVTVGGSEAVDLAFRTILDPGDEVIVVDPSFVSYAPMAFLAGGEPVRVPTFAENGFVPTMDDLERAASPRTRAMIVNYPNNPSGATLTAEQMNLIMDFVLRRDLILISDEIYLPLTYEGDALSFASYRELRDRLILIHGFSKAWAMTGWRLGMAAGPEDLIEGMTKVHQYGIMCTPTTAQYAAIEALRNGGDEVEAMRKEYDRRRRFFTHHLNRIGFDCFVPGGAFYAFPSIRAAGMTSQEFAEKLLEEENVAVIPGTAFGNCGEGHVRCSYASSLKELREAVQRMEQFAHRYVRK
ncbi:MAG: aminotransferase class I/II-fold pyridoxal phosphate-dependent enzyme [Candidatus Omnitrophica bacterium]|nr:aminotransferase class I/II-fold pyridoxal phosphate-dependent enzyme [Candidatus Omnitrophota bacterium]